MPRTKRQCMKCQVTSNYLKSLQKKSQNTCTSPQQPLGGRPVKTSPPSRFHYAGTDGQKHPQHLNPHVIFRSNSHDNMYELCTVL